jgi:hypothetical protein
MRITVQFALWLSLVFAAACISYGLVGLGSIDADATATRIEDARGFAGFWLFLGSIGLACAGGSWWLLRSGADAADE